MGNFKNSRFFSLKKLCPNFKKMRRNIIMVHYGFTKGEKKRLLTRRQFRLEHVHGHYVYNQHPYGAVQHVLFVLDKTDGTQTLTLQTPAIRIRSAQLSRHVLLEFFHVEQLEKRHKNIVKTDRDF